MATSTKEKFETFLRTVPPSDPGKKMDALLFVSATDCNPNGEPDDGNRPRQDQETSNGLISGVSLKRHIRDTIQALMGDEKGFALYMSRHSILDYKLLAIHEQVGISPKKASKKAKDAAQPEEGVEAEVDDGVKLDDESEKKARDLACKMYIDTRLFGAVMSSKMANCGQVRGPVQIAWARSIDPVLIVDDSLTRGDLQTEREAKSNSKLSTFGSRPRVAYGLYQSAVHVTPAWAGATGIGKQDLEVFWEAMARMYEYGRSSSRDNMVVEQIIVFEHDSPLGRAPAHKLFRMIDVKRNDQTKPARRTDDYSFPTEEQIQGKINAAGYKGVKVHFLL
jgi:CRISPR-associated protein Csd2